MKKMILVTLAAIVVLMAVSFSSASSDTVVLVEKSCSTSCHDIGKTCRKLGKRDVARWTKTVTRMVKHGAPLDAVQVQEIANQLANPTPELEALCK